MPAPTGWFETISPARVQRGSCGEEEAHGNVAPLDSRLLLAGGRRLLERRGGAGRGGALLSGVEHEEGLREERGVALQLR